MSGISHSTPYEAKRWLDQVPQQRSCPQTELDIRNYIKACIDRADPLRVVMASIAKDIGDTLLIPVEQAKANKALGELLSAAKQGVTFQHGLLSNETINKQVAEHQARYDLVFKTIAVSCWASVKSAPRDETLFVCRHKNKPHVTFEAMIYQDQESWEIPEKYNVLHDMTNDEPLDGDWEDYEWKAIDGA